MATSVWFVLALALCRGEPVRTEFPVHLDTAGASVTVPHTATVSGTLRAWVESTAFDPVLGARDSTGALLAEDDDSGGKPTPWLDLAVEPGHEVQLVVRSADGMGSARLVVVELEELAATRADADAFRDELHAVVDGLAREATPERRAAPGVLAAELCAQSALATSDALQIVLLDTIQAVADAGDYPGVLTATERLIAVQSEILPPESRRRLVAVVQHGSALGQVGRATEAIETLRDVLTVFRRTLPTTDRSVPTTETALGALLFANGDIRGAVDRFEAALRGSSTILAADDVNLAQLRANLAVGAFYLGDLERARTCVDAARASGAHIVPGSPLDLQLRAALSATVTEQGDYQTGRILAEEALASARANYPAGHVAVAMAELNEAIARIRAGEYATARATITRILAAPPPELAPTQAVIVQSRLNLASLDLIENDWAEADRELTALAESVGGDMPPENPLMRAIMRNRALALRGLGHLDEAAAVESELLDTTRALLPPDHPERIGIELQCAGTDASRGRFPEARDGVETATRALVDMLASRALILSPREAEATARNASVLIDTALGLLIDLDIARVRPGAEGLAFELGETARGIGIAALRSLRAVESAGPVVQALRDTTRQAQIDLVRAARNGGPDDLRAAIEARDAAERALRSGFHGEAALPRSIRSPDVAQHLGVKELAVAWRVVVRDRSAHAQRFESEDALLAAWVRADGTVGWLDLGPLAPIESACRAWRAELERAPADRAATRRAGERVRALVVDPIQSRVPDAERWSIAPDGPLLTLPLDALPDVRAQTEQPADAEGALLGDHLRVDTVWSFDTAAMPRNVAGERTATATPHGLLAVGDVDFGDVAASTLPSWSALPATGREIDAVCAAWRATHAESDAPHVLRGTSADARGLVGLAPDARWIHVATHGAFDEDAAPASLLTASAGEGRPMDRARAVRALVPLVRCELVLAGANHDPEATLTAEELGTLDLSNCRLAVLSACDTGRGEIVTGQGAASFQRALVAAGAQHCVTSLWSVPDDATRELMAHFYGGLWQDGLTPSEALWRAKRALRDRRAPPRDWAAWVLASSFAE